jgi:transcriptional regulator with XRE-family HTH domain
MNVGFDLRGFFRAVEGRRVAEGLSWRELGRRLDLSPSTFSRMSRGRRPDVDTFLRLLAWLDMPAEGFMDGAFKRTNHSARPALETIAAALRHDPSLSPDDVAPLEEIVKVAYNRFRRIKR